MQIFTEALQCPKREPHVLLNISWAWLVTRFGPDGSCKILRLQEFGKGRFAGKQILMSIFNSSLAEGRVLDSTNWSKGVFQWCLD